MHVDTPSFTRGIDNISTPQSKPLGTSGGREHKRHGPFGRRELSCELLGRVRKATL